MATIFINYRQEDTSPEAILLRDALRNELGVESVFHDASSLPAGAIWPAEIRDGLEKATLVLAVIGPDWLRAGSDEWGRRRIDNEQDWVRQELTAAIAKNKKIIPVLVRGAKIPPPEVLPEPIRSLSSHQEIEIRRSYWDQDVQWLLKQVAAEIKQGKPQSGRGHAVPAARDGHELPADSLVRVNGYKLFYFRINHKLTFADLARETGMDRFLIRTLEKVNQEKGVLEVSCFGSCERHVLERLEEALACQGKLEAGRKDDFLTQYMQFYQVYGGGGRKPRQDSGVSAQRGGDHLPLHFETKAVVFDFDGTLTHPHDNRTTWEKIWVLLGYSIKDCADLHRRFQQEKITHQQWCDKTRDKFLAKGLRVDQLQRLAREISLVQGVRETVGVLRGKGVKLFILSGSIKQIIREVLGNLQTEFEEIKANEILFDSAGVISEIQGTPYDFKGKALFLKRVLADWSLDPSEVLFVGNSCNDIFASQSGVRTLCVNPRFTDPDNEEHWTYAIREMTSLREIMEFVKI